MLYCIIHGYLPVSLNDCGSLNDLSWSHISKSLWSGCTNCSGGGGGGVEGSIQQNIQPKPSLFVLKVITFIIIFTGNEYHFSSCLGSLKGILDLFVCISRLNNTIMVFILLCLLLCLSVNPLSPNSDQHQFSPNNIHRLSSATSMRINQMITKRKISDLLSISPN